MCGVSPSPCYRVARVRCYEVTCPRRTKPNQAAARQAAAAGEARPGWCGRGGAVYSHSRDLSSAPQLTR